MSCKALIGVPLKSSEFLKLEQTHLADVIAEEAGNEHYRAHDTQFEAATAQKVGAYGMANPPKLNVHF